jgi:tetratricopeptide (TPR) repeat protein
VLSEKTKIEHARDLFRQKEFDRSFEVCADYLKENPGDFEAIRLKAKLLNMRNDLKAAIDEITVLLAENGRPEPCDFFYRGRWLLEIGSTAQACLDFQKIIDLETVYDFDYYVEEARLLLAYAKAKLGDKIGAEMQLEFLNSESASWINNQIINLEALRLMID